MNQTELDSSLEGLYTAVLADILDGHGLKNQCLNAEVEALTNTTSLSGRIFTMRAVTVDEEPAEPYKLEMAAVDAARAGDVLVVDAGFNRTCGFWGELLTTACLAKGIRGIVMSACTRDLWTLKKLDFPVFGIGACPADSKGRLEVVVIEEPIAIDGVSIKNGDVVVGDEDGVVVIPNEIAPDVIRLAREKVSGENIVRDELAAGIPVSEVFRKHGIL